MPVVVPRRTAIAVAMTCAFPLSVRANEAPGDPALLEMIVITADPFARTADRLARPAEVLAGPELDRRRGVTLGETLEHQMGVSTADFGRGAGRPVIRGQGGPRVLMLENGIAAMDASDVSSDHEVSIDPAHAGQIEILKGPATLLFGSGASAGAVNVVDERLPTTVSEGFRGRLRGNLGSGADERGTSGRMAYGFGDTQLALDGAWLDAGDYDIAGNAAADGSGRHGTLANSAVRRFTGGVSAARFWERGSVGASYSRFETEYGLPTEEQAFIDLAQDRLDLEARVQSPFAGFEAIRLRVGQGRYEHTEFEAADEPGTVFRNQQSEARFELHHRPFAGMTGVFGVQRRDRELEAIGEEAFVPSTATRALGVFLVEQAPTGFGDLEFGLRSDRDRYAPRDGASGPRRFGPVSFSLGARWAINPRHDLKLYATRAERSPVAEELYSAGPHLATGSFERGNPAFGVERARNLELGLERHDGPLGWRVNVYAQRIAGYVYQREVDAGLDADGSGTAASDGLADRVDGEGGFDPQGELLLVDYVAGDARFWGGEAEAGYAWNMAGAGWRARVSGDLVRGRVDGGGDLPRITPARVGAGLQAQRGAWSASVEATRVHGQDRVASLETRTDGYTMVSADVEYTRSAPGGELLLFLRGRNLLDEDARRHTSFIKDRAPLPGAGVILGFEWRIE